MTATTQTTALPTPAIDIREDSHLVAVTNIVDVQAMPEDTKDQVAAKWIAAKQIESAGETAKDIRSKLGTRLTEEFGMAKDDRITVNGTSWKFATRNGSTSGVTLDMLAKFKKKYEKVSWIAPAIDTLIAEGKTSYTSYSLKLG